MNLGARTAAWSGGGGWMNPYVTDGLVSLWEGQFGFRDIVGGENIGQYGTVAVTNEGFVCQGGALYSDDYAKIYTALSNQGELTVEVAYSFDQYSNFVGVFFGNQFIPGTSDSNIYKRFCSYSADNYYWQWSYAQKVENRYGNKNTSVLNRAKGTYSFVIEGSSARISNGISSTTASIATGDSIGNGLYVMVPERPAGIFTGKIYGIRVYDRALTAAEIAANYAVDAARFGLT